MPPKVLCVRQLTGSYQYVMAEQVSLLDIISIHVNITRNNYYDVYIMYIISVIIGYDIT
jgi:hypothetical protein